MRAAPPGWLLALGLCAAGFTTRAATAAAAAPAHAPAAAPADSPVFVLLWFDTEDYLLPADDGATLDLARWLRAEGVKATFKLVGEKARVLEQRRRKDVIAALAWHDIGYHTNFHSVQPTPAVYLSNLGWDEGAAEFERREGPGLADLKRIFRVTPSCYGQPGTSWGPQAYPALKRLGVPVYLDAGNHVGLDGKPHYYGGLLTLYDLAHTLHPGLGGAKDLEAAKERFDAAHAKLRAEGGGVASVYLHPNEFVHKDFWDIVNFKAGANPPRDRWVLPPAATADETRVAFQTFHAYVRHVKARPGVRFATATDAARLYGDRAPGRKFTPDEVRRAAAAVTDRVDFQRAGDHALAPSEILALVTRLATLRPLVFDRTPEGPADPPPPLPAAVKTTWSQLHRSAEDVAHHIERRARVPSSVWLGSVAVPPEAFLSALARVVAAGGAPPAPDAPIDVRPTVLETARRVPADGPALWDWPIFPPGFRAPALMDLARRQAWTIKPALLDARAAASGTRARATGR